jgi:hypothetical protein
VALVRYLPADGATARAEGIWPERDELLAAIVEQIDALARLTYQAASGKRAPWRQLKVPRPRPEGPVAPPREATPEEVARMFGLGVPPNGG